MLALETVPMKLNNDASNCAYVMCTHVGHEVCSVIRDWIYELGAAVDAGDLVKAREVWGRLKRS